MPKKAADAFIEGCRMRMMRGDTTQESRHSRFDGAAKKDDNAAKRFAHRIYFALHKTDINRCAMSA
jgi:hypothetical protein